MFARAGHPTSLRCVAVGGGGDWEGTVTLALLWADFQSLPLLPTIKLGLSGADFLVGGLVYILGPCGSLQWTLLWGWEFLLLPSEPPQVFSVRGFWGFISPHWNPGLCHLSCSPVVPPSLSALKCRPALSASNCLVWSSSCCLALSPLLPGCPSPPLLSVWMNVSSLTPSLLDFHTVQFSQFCCFLFLNLLLSFFWLCEEAQCVYLHLHLGWQSHHFF